MKIRLRGRGAEPAKVGSPAVEGAEPSALLQQKTSRRQLWKLVAAGAGLAGVAGLGPLAMPARRAEALYLVNDDMTVTGNLTVGGAGNSSFSGNLGVGRTPATKFHVAGAAPAVRVENTNPGGHAYQLAVGDSAADALDFIDASVGLRRVTVTAAGNVGVGTASPQAAVHAAGAFFTTGNSTPGTGTGVRVTYNPLNDFGVIDAYAWPGTGYKPLLIDASTLRVNVQAGGNVGVGTDIPVERVDIVGRVRVTAGFMVNSVLAIDATGTARQSYFAV